MRRPYQVFTRFFRVFARRNRFAEHLCIFHAIPAAGDWRRSCWARPLLISDRAIHSHVGRESSPRRLANRRIPMKRFVVWGALALAFVALVPLSAAAQRSVVVTANLSGTEENPPITTAGVGKVTCTIGETNTTCQVVFFNAETSITGGHIHAGARGTNGPVILDFRPPAVSNDLGFTQTVEASALRPAAAQGINSYEDFVQSCSSGGCYFNLHTQLSPGGYIRGQLCPASAAASVFTGIATCITAPLQQ